MRKLERDFYAQDTVVVAKALLGKLLVHRFEGIEYIAKIVETEAYVGPHDLAAHSCRGLTKRHAGYVWAAGVCVCVSNLWNV